jgi:hypothetical protein
MSVFVSPNPFAILQNIDAEVAKRKKQLKKEENERKVRLEQRFKEKVKKQYLAQLKLDREKKEQERRMMEEDKKNYSLWLECSWQPNGADDVIQVSDLGSSDLELSKCDFLALDYSFLQLAETQPRMILDWEHLKYRKKEARKLLSLPSSSSSPSLQLQQLKLAITECMKDLHSTHPPDDERRYDYIPRGVDRRDEKYWSKVAIEINLYSVQGFVDEWIMIDHPLWLEPDACTFEHRRRSIIHVPTGKRIHSLTADYRRGDHCFHYRPNFQVMTWSPQLDSILKLPVLCRRLLQDDCYYHGDSANRDKGIDEKKPRRFKDSEMTTEYHTLVTTLQRDTIVRQYFPKQILPFDCCRIIFDYLFSCISV